MVDRIEEEFKAVKGSEIKQMKKYGRMDKKTILKEYSEGFEKWRKWCLFLDGKEIITISLWGE